MSRLFLLMGLLCGCGAAAQDVVNRADPAKAAVVAVDAVHTADKAAMMACLAYKQAVFSGLIQADDKADDRCDSLTDVPESDTPEVTPLPVPITPTNFFPGKETVPA